MPLLNDMPLERTNQIFRHPIHQDGVGTLVRLITALRRCRSAEDFYDFQQDLLARVLEVQEHRAGCRRVAKQWLKRRSAPVDRCRATFRADWCRSTSRIRRTLTC
ncbi:hypothetical protein [Amycolatopsis australiensis]|uniref:hypothetical protein n=1 Tax=Amycolatopsis australiensis TaxID=546364 RepID=UPI0015A6B741|nr:hypothetical protein [Amycolatopsis australiensis]